MAISSVTKLCNKLQDSSLSPDNCCNTPLAYSGASQRYVKLLPDLSAAAFRQKLTLELITWLQLRYLNTTGSGFINLEKAIEGLRSEFGYCRKTAERHILRTEGLFLRVNGSGPRTTIQIYGLLKVCKYFTITLGDKHWRMVTPDHFDTMGKAKAQLYASIHKPQHIRANPISRQTLTERTGLHKVQQRRYEKAAHIRRTPNYSFYKDDNPLGRCNYKPERQEIFTRAGGHYQVNKRLGNTYHTEQTAGAKGMLKKVNTGLNARLKRSSIPGEAPTLTKRFFASFRRMVKVLTRRTTLPKEGFYLINSGYRTISGRLEWCYYAS